MDFETRRLAPVAGLAAAAVLTCLSRPACAQDAEQKTAEQVYKNIVELKGTPADQLMPAMQFISASLGVECNFCHVEGKRELDDKLPKKTARAMIAMTLAINRDSFKGRQETTCYSCHRGAEHPAGIPPVLESDAAKPAEAKAIAPAGAPPAADSILDRYVAALGGADAIRRITSRSMKGSISVGGHEAPIELLAKAPNKRISITRMGGGESVTAFDGTAGWLGGGGRPPREMTAAESWAAGLDAEFYLPLRWKEIFPSVRGGRPETIGGAECQMLIASGPGHPPVRLYFDVMTGLLVRTVRYAETPVGRLPTQVDYADYREADGVKIPFRWTLSRPNGRFTIQIADVKSNLPIDDARFSKTAADAN